MQMNRWSVIAISLLGSFYYYHSTKSGPPLSRVLEQSGDPCYQKEKCVIVYVTPWCPACESSIETIKEMDRLWNAPDSKRKYGLKVFVGQDELQKCQEKVTSIGNFARVDERDQFYKFHRVSVFPMWLVFDAKGKEVKRVKGGFSDPSQADLIGEQILGLHQIK